VKDELHDLVLTEKQNEKWQATQEEWVAAAEVKKYEDRVGIAPDTKKDEN